MLHQTCLSVVILPKSAKFPLVTDIVQAVIQLFGVYRQADALLRRLDEEYICEWEQGSGIKTFHLVN